MNDYEELAKRLVTVLELLARLEEEAEATQAKIAKLKQSNMTDATIHWRKDRNGEASLMELLHHQDSDYHKQTGRRREYVGNDPQRIEEARERVRKFHKYQTLREEERVLTAKAQNIRRWIKQLEYQAFGEKQTWGHEAPTAVDLVSPQQNGLDDASPQGMSPQDVVDYFQQSEVLKYLAPDLKSQWGL